VKHAGTSSLLPRQRQKRDFPLGTHRTLGILLGCLALLATPRLATAQDRMLFNFEMADAATDWRPAKLAEVKDEAPAPKVAITAEGATSGKRALSLTFDGGTWPVIAATRIAVTGSWKEFQTLQADLTVDRSLYIRAL
jgi:hypothetical protein